MNAAELHHLDTHQLREMVQSLQAKVQATESALTFKQAVIDKITHEMAVLKRMKFGAKAERYSPEQISLLEEAVEADLEALASEMDRLAPGKQAMPDRQTARRMPLPTHLPRRDVHYEPHSTTCHCGCALKRIGEDIAEKLDYQPGSCTVERHVRGKWVCARCETLVQAPVPPHVIDKGIPTAGLLAQVLVAKYADHLPLYRQESIFARAGMALSRSTLAQWVGACGVQLQPLVDALKQELLLHPVLHADETPVAMLKPGNGKTHRAYLWSYCSTRFSGMHAVVFDFAESRAGQHAREFLGVTPTGGWRGTLVCDQFSGYKALFEMGVVEAGCLAHARRKFYDLWVSHQSTVAEQALRFFTRLYDVERQLQELSAEERLQRRRSEAKPVADLLHAWLLQQRALVPSGSATARAIQYSLGCWNALTRYLEDGRLPPDNNRVENQIRPVALGRANWLFAGSLRAGRRAAAVMSLVHSARLNGHDPYAYLRDVLERLPTQPASRIGELLPHRWVNADAGDVRRARVDEHV
ncbi:IS66 family transposase [Pseudorhodoferax soli]|uniref:Transposase n=1 Tax=Pseudorhodoferax soli TaxID=545864 RepID=A0A368XY73_9BURK|nr:transposase [Pseudorhodoferax soli]